MDFTKFHCPVCNKNFLENDDVVVCPECGTPHHRECYKLTGKCFNEALHGTDISVDNFKNPEEEKTGKIPHFKPEENSSEATAKNDENPFKINVNEAPDFIKFSSAQDHLIEGKHSSLFEAAVGKNQRYYIPRFSLMSSLNKGISFNFIGFIFPLAWSIYRKMYKLSALVLASYLLVFGISFYQIYTNPQVTQAIDECYEEMVENPELYSDYQLLLYETSDVTLTEAQQNLVDALNGVTTSKFIIVLVYLIQYAPKVLIGILGNKFYLKKLTKNITNAEAKGLEGDKLKLYLYKRYGTLPLILGIILGILEITFLR